jgi:hypothetical protein
MHKYNYNKMLKIPDSWDGCEIKGNQILHYLSAAIEIKNDQSTLNYVQDHMLNALRLETDAEILKFAVELADINSGLVLELGVGGGRTTNFIAALCSKKTIHGFDSFQGLPEDWQGPCKKGIFALLTEDLPPLYHNIAVHVGMFKDTLPIFIKEYLRPADKIAFIHIDCELYQSTKTIFDLLADYIRSGTIIHFDEYYNYPGWELHEHKAFKEFINERNLKYEYVAYNVMHQQVTIKIK